MKKLIEVDPFTKTTTYHEYDPLTNKTHIEQTQDVEGILNYTQRLANNTEYKRQGIKSDWYHFATVPNTVIMEIKQKYNLDVFNKDDLPKIERVLQQDYKKLLTVNRI